jgi:hypothetical protein
MSSGEFAAWANCHGVLPQEMVEDQTLFALRVGGLNRQYRSPLVGRDFQFAAYTLNDGFEVRVGGDTGDIQLGADQLATATAAGLGIARTEVTSDMKARVAARKATYSEAISGIECKLFMAMQRLVQSGVASSPVSGGQCVVVLARGRLFIFETGRSPAVDDALANIEALHRQISDIVRATIR